jgi:hypothetical protein
MKSIIIVILILVVVGIMLKFNSSNQTEGYSNLSKTNYYGQNDDYSTCYANKKIYLTSDDSAGHGEASLEKRFGKLHIKLNCNLPYALGGVFHTSYGAYHAFMINSKTQDTINLGTLVRHGDRFYKLNTELLGDYRGYDELKVIRKTEDFPVVNVLSGSITKQNCSGGL